MHKPLAAALLCLALFACPKAVPTTVMGSDDESMDRYAAQLEEFRTREEPSCGEVCGIKSKVCDISQAVCGIASKSTERDDFQRKCITAQEDCATFSEKCAGCSN